MEKQLRDMAVKLFKDGSVDAIIGFEAGSLPLRSSPCVIRSAEDSDKLIWDRNCGSNLATYLLPIAKANPEMKIGIMAKGCDSRSIVGLIKERQIERWEYFVSEMSKCIKCYACRGACPSCYCTQCFIDQNQPQWFGKTTELSDTIIFHLVRAFHVAGRCVRSQLHNPGMSVLQYYV